ncbi:acyltransferase [Bifidobacterium lemurum]|uniref:Acyltransferase n=1 Tax=Bifidobacterium lemurum TaxID=1603886 RepID=A0A261FQ63_9BIFI|nr:acyltransferase family protein [Bifidobacterium lemurum]OZG61320.1 acyltransferase [Bifidobacterium lemurum]QOL34708.1 acyltransferase family protein [Bifidobacterium lemurum]
MNNQSVSSRQNSLGRIAWVDYGKGFAMILVFWGHTLCPDMVRDFFYAFHMPLFFFLSGYVFSVKHYNSLKAFVIKRIRTLLIPGFVFGVVTIIIVYINGMIIGEPYSFSLIQYLIGIVAEIRGGSYGVIPWFFTSLFLIDVSMYIFERFISSSIKMQILFGIVFSLVGYCYSIYIGHILPWAIETAASGLLFFIAGKAMRSIGKDIEKRLSVLPLILFCGVVTELSVLLNRYVTGEHVDIYLNEYGSYPFYILGAFAGIAFSIGLMIRLESSSSLMPLSTIMTYIGSNSLIYYSFNNVLLLVCEELLGLFIDMDSSMMGFEQTILGLFIVISACLLCVPIVTVINHFFPEILGKRGIDRGIGYGK